MTRVVPRVCRWVLTAAVVLLGLVLATPANSWHAEQTIDKLPETLDASWRLELPVRLARGELAGRDFIFTYGPLYQLLHAAPLFLVPGDLASYARFYDLPAAWVTALCVWALLATTGAPLSWRAAAYLLWEWLWPPAVSGEIKPMGALLLVTLCATHLGTPGEGRRP